MTAPSRPDVARASTRSAPHYAETLRRWRERFLASLDEVRALGYDERFVRTWDFYLAACEALLPHAADPRRAAGARPVNLADSVIERGVLP